MIASLRRLADAGHIKSLPAKNGERKAYRLTSGVFAVKGAAPESKIPETPLFQCRECGHMRKLQRSGFCGKCAAKVRTERTVAKILRETPNASDEQVYLRLRARGAKTVQQAIAKAKGAA